MHENTIEDFYRAYHIDAAGKRVGHTFFMACEDGGACDKALSLQEKGGWPAMELWVRHRKVSCEAGPRELPTMDPDSTWGRRIEGSGFRLLAEKMRTEAATMNDPENKQTMLNLAANYVQMANRLTKKQSSNLKQREPLL